MELYHEGYEEWKCFHKIGDPVVITKNVDSWYFTQLHFSWSPNMVLSV